jgi:hypothetical protein
VRRDGLAVPGGRITPRSTKGVCREKLEEAAVILFLLDHENIELRQRVQEFEEQLAGGPGAAPLAPSTP